jgi:hypothetical protein
MNEQPSFVRSLVFDLAFWGEFFVGGMIGREIGLRIGQVGALGGKEFGVLLGAGVGGAVGLQLGLRIEKAFWGETSFSWLQRWLLSYGTFLYLGMCASAAFFGAWLGLWAAFVAVIAWGIAWFSFMLTEIRRDRTPSAAAPSPADPNSLLD